MNGPDEVSRRLVSLLESGDLDAIADLYEDGAVFVDLDGEVRGLDGIRAVHLRFRDAGNTLGLNHAAVFESGDIALVHWSWTVTLSDASTIDGVSAEVLRRQSDGTWKFVIDNSDGSAVVRHGE